MSRARSRSPRGGKKPVLPDGLKNPNFEALAEDHFFHIEDAGLNTRVDLKAKLGDVKFVLMGGPPERAEFMAEKLSSTFGLAAEAMGSKERYRLIKVGPVMAISHGIGMPSMSIVLHELTKALHYAGCKDVTYVRLGTSGGVGVEPGTLVVASHGVNAALECKYETTVLGKKKAFDTAFDPEVAEELAAAAKRVGHPVVIAKTMATDDYYEEQARLDGALATGYTESEKMAFLKQVYDSGVRNMEMEGTALAAFCGRTGIRGALICAALLDRLKGDQTPEQASPEQISAWNQGTIHAVIEWLRTKLPTNDAAGR
eukprot:CAMPEP_0172677796 /NCGR_PEP_ID=MMETSP1074-20121228/14927_1 /TAXON_ID=2916 /ORGANISM="Ceratium fusus, Strain PA161109" /LENGTH=313 /DNA_ID=CAMNT_0013495697 /DNA_START=55 /DNA_END=996 /DNA_ORIENTATION=-